MFPVCKDLSRHAEDSNQWGLKWEVNLDHDTVQETFSTTSEITAF